MPARDRRKGASAHVDFSDALRGSGFSQNEEMEFHLEDWSGSEGPSHLHVDIATFEDWFNRSE